MTPQGGESCLGEWGLEVSRNPCYMIIPPTLGEAGSARRRR